jgi:hypothetical protein
LGQPRQRSTTSSTVKVQVSVDLQVPKLFNNLYEAWRFMKVPHHKYGALIVAVSPHHTFNYYFNVHSGSFDEFTDWYFHGR